MRPLNPNHLVYIITSLGPYIIVTFANVAILILLHRIPLVNSFPNSKIPQSHKFGHKIIHLLDVENIVRKLLHPHASD